MKNRARPHNEHRSIIIRTKKDLTVGCYHFITYGRNTNIPMACNRYESFTKVSDRIEITWNVGGDVFVLLYEKHPNGLDVMETVVFDKKYVTDIIIETDFKELRDKGE